MHLVYQFVCVLFVCARVCVWAKRWCHVYVAAAVAVAVAVAVVVAVVVAVAVAVVVAVVCVELCLSPCASHMCVPHDLLGVLFPHRDAHQHICICQIGEVQFKLDYTPHKVDGRALLQGRLEELMHLVRWERLWLLLVSVGVRCVFWCRLAM